MEQRAANWSKCIDFPLIVNDTEESREYFHRKVVEAGELTPAKREVLGTAPLSNEGFVARLHVVLVLKLNTWHQNFRLNSAGCSPTVLR